MNHQQPDGSFEHLAVAQLHPETVNWAHQVVCQDSNNAEKQMGMGISGCQSEGSCAHIWSSTNMMTAPTILDRVTSSQLH